MRREHMMEAHARRAFDKTEQGPKHLILLDVLSLCTPCTRHYECAPYAARAQSIPSTAAKCFHGVHDLQFVTKAIWRRRVGDSWVPASSHWHGVCMRAWRGTLRPARPPEKEERQPKDTGAHSWHRMKDGLAIPQAWTLSKARSALSFPGRGLL